jgi:predicted transcriptional regulator
MARPRGSLSTRRRMLSLARKTETLLEKVDERLLTDLDVRLIRDRHKLASTLLKALKGADAAKQKRSSTRQVRF